MSLMCHKILNNYVYVGADIFFTRRTVDLTRGHCVKLYKSRTVSVRDGNFFSNVSLMLGIHYLMLLFRRVPLRVLNVDCSLWIYHLIELYI